MLMSVTMFVAVHKNTTRTREQSQKQDSSSKNVDITRFQDTLASFWWNEGRGQISTIRQVGNRSHDPKGRTDFLCKHLKPKYLFGATVCVSDTEPRTSKPTCAPSTCLLISSHWSTFGKRPDVTSAYLWCSGTSLEASFFKEKGRSLSFTLRIGEI